MISLKKLSREFQVGDSPVLALRNIDLTIEAGEYVSIMGPSGSGKSTLLNMLGLIDRPSDGEYFLKGEETSVLSESDRAALRRAHMIRFSSLSFSPPPYRA